MQRSGLDSRPRDRSESGLCLNLLLLWQMLGQDWQLYGTEQSLNSRLSVLVQEYPF